MTSSRTNRATRGLALALVLCAGVPAGAAGRAEAEQAAPAAPDPQAEIARALDLAARIVGRSGALARIWPGYWPASQAFIINIPRTGGLLIMRGDPPEGWEPMRGPEVPRQLRGRAFFRSGPIEGANRPFIMRFPLGAGRTATLVNLGKDSNQAAITLLHENFHDFQTSHFRFNTANQFVAPTAVPDRVAFAASAELERRILAAALTARAGPQRIELIRQYLAVRRAREAALPAEVIEVERGFEQLEGVAHYVDRMAHHLIYPGAGVDALLVESLAKSLVAARGQFTTIWFRSRSYSTGAALAHLLSGLDPKGWRRALAQGGRLDALIEQKVGAAPDPAAAAAAARRRFGHAELLAQMEAPLREAESKEIKSVADFLALGRYAVAVEVKSAAGDETLSPTFAATEMSFLAPTHIVLRHAEVFNFGSGGKELLVRGRPVMMDEADGHKRTTIMLDAAPAIEGEAALGPGTHRLDGLRIRQPGFELRLDGPVAVTVEQGRMTIRSPAP